MKDPSTHGADPPDHLPVVRFILPDSLLAVLREHRERQQAGRPRPRGSRSAPHAITSLLSSLFRGADLPSTAREYVDGMNGLQEQVERECDAFLLDPGMGSMTYLAADGRIVVDGRTWDGEGIHFESSLDKAIGALVVGAKKTGVSELLGDRSATPG
jgi:hypothetical protein